MNGSGINNRPFGQPPPMMGRGQSNPVNEHQQQHMMMLQQQQFIARQQVIQREQLQKQRQLRQEEEKQAGIIVAIRDLQQKTLHQQQPQLHPPNLQMQRPQLPHHPPRGLSPSVNQAQAANVRPYRYNPALSEDRVGGTQHTSMTPPLSGGNGRHSYNLSVPPPPLNNLGFPPPNSLTSARSNTVPPLHVNSSNPPLLHTSTTLGLGSTQYRQPMPTPGRNVVNHGTGLVSNAPLDSRSPVFINQPPGFDKAGHIIGLTSGSDRSICQLSQFGNLPEDVHRSSHIPAGGHPADNVTVKNSRPPLLDFPGKSSAMGLPSIASDRSHLPTSSPQMPQQNTQNNSWSISGNKQDDYRGHVSGDSSSRISSRETERGDRLSSDFSRSQYRNDNSDRSRNDYRSSNDRSNRNSSDNRSNLDRSNRSSSDTRSNLDRSNRNSSDNRSNLDRSNRNSSDNRSNLDRSDRNSSDNRSNLDRSNSSSSDNRSSHDRIGSRATDQNQDRGSPHRSHSSRYLENTDERSRSSTRSRDEATISDSRSSHSRSYERMSGHESRRHGSRVIDLSPSNTRDRNRPNRTSRERSLSTSRNSVSSTTLDSYSRSKLSNTRRPSPQSSRDSSSSKRDRITKRSRSPTSSEQSYSGQLSQYRQDLLNSEHINRDPSSSSPKRRKGDMDMDDDSNINKEDELQSEADSISYFTRSCPADLYFSRNSATGDMEATTRMVELENKFEEEIVKRADKVRATQVTVEEPPTPQPVHHHHHHHHQCSGNKSSSCDSSSDGEDDDDDDDDDDGSCSQIMEEWDKRKKHPYSLHPELWFNLTGQANDGLLCRCSIKSRQAGIRHEIYPGEKLIHPCNDENSNLSQLHHYRITMSPYTNFLTKVPTLINHDNHEYIFEGFSMYSHVKLENIPPCKLLRFNIEYTIHFIPESAPENFTVRSLNLFNRFIFTEILELLDVDWTGPSGGCQRFHFLPRFCRTLPDSGCKEVLSMNTVLSFLLKSVKPLVDESRVEEIMQCGESDWHARVDNLRGMIVTNPGMRPSSIRVDQLDRKVTTPVIRTENFDDSSDEKSKATKKAKTDGDAANDEVKDETDGQPKYPLIIHQGYRPAQLSYAGDPVYRKAWKQYVKFRHLLNSKPKILAADKLKLKEQEEKLREIRMKKTMKREVTVELSCKGFLCTGLRADLCQHALMVPVLMSHLRFHVCLDVLEEELNYKFQDRNLLQLSLTHTSYRTNYGTNPDHTRNSLTNCGMRQVEYGDRRIHYQNTRKRGICILVDIMSRFGKQEETVSEIPHNERLEFLGDAVIEFLTSVHLFYMFPWLEEGGLTTYRMALVQNQHLAILAKKMKLQDFMLYVHGPDLCHESDLRHAMANCCEAIMGALFLDGGLEVVDRIFSKTLFDDEDVLLHTWNDLPRHVLQQEEPGGDRHWVKSSPILQKMEKFEERIGIKFSHIRLLAKSFTHRNIGVNPLTLGHNQRLEFLGDTVLQLVASEYLYRHYPEHHEGHLSLLRSSLVNSRTQGLVYDDLGMSEFIICNENAANEGMDMKTKQRADILESFVGALFVDKDLDYCRSFCNVCFFPRLKDFIMNQDWNDPKSQLQQCCLTLREVGGGEPDIPVYKVIKSIGPTNTRKYVVAVYFRGKRLARGTGHSIQQAEMAAATQALKKRAELFPILQHQRRFLERIRKEDSEKDSDKEEVSSSRMVKRPRPNQRRRVATRGRAKFD